MRVWLLPIHPVHQNFNAEKLIILICHSAIEWHIMTKQRVGTVHSKYNTNDNQVGDDLKGLNGLLGKKSICSSLVLRTSRGCQTVTRVVGSCAESPSCSPVDHGNWNPSLTLSKTANL